MPAKVNLPPGARRFKHCSIEVGKMSDELLERDGDGRKRRHKAESRYKLLTKLAAFARRDGSSCFVSVPTLARRCRWSERQTQRYLRELEDMRWVVDFGPCYPRVTADGKKIIFTRNDKAGDIYLLEKPLD